MEGEETADEKDWKNGDCDEDAGERVGDAEDLTKPFASAKPRKSLVWQHKQQNMDSQFISPSPDQRRGYASRHKASDEEHGY